MKAGKIARIIGLAAIGFVFIFGICAANTPKEVRREVWDEQTTHGSIGAENYFVVYTDIMCPYCIAFENALIEHEEDLLAYLEEHNVLLEVKMTDFLYEYGAGFKNSQYSAEATYCAKNEGKFWDYYSFVVTTVWNDYLKDQGKSALSVMESFTKDYWIDLGKQVGLGDTFEDCVRNDKTLKEIQTNTAKAAKEVEGIPYIILNDTIAPGFDLSWGWDEAKYFFDLGLGLVAE